MKRVHFIVLLFFMFLSKFGIAQTLSDSLNSEFLNFTETANGISIEMVAIHGGTFIMGNSESERIEIIGNDTLIELLLVDAHKVTVGDFYIGKTEVTYEQYDIFCDATGREKPYDNNRGRGEKPVVGISWEEATAYCEWLSLVTKKNYRLPTEAEWEYACRAGTTTPFNTGNSLSTFQANTANSSQMNSSGTIKICEVTRPVGSYAPNAWGLYDMHGNVREWCADYCDFIDGTIITDTYYEGAVNPVCKTGSYRLFRGGSMCSMLDFCTSYYRRCYNGHTRLFDTGFRLVCSTGQ